MFLLCQVEKQLCLSGRGKDDSLKFPSLFIFKDCSKCETLLCKQHMMIYDQKRRENFFPSLFIGSVEVFGACNCSKDLGKFRKNKIKVCFLNCKIFTFITQLCILLNYRWEKNTTLFQQILLPLVDFDLILLSLLKTSFFASSTQTNATFIWLEFSRYMIITQQRQNVAFTMTKKPRWQMHFLQNL